MKPLPTLLTLPLLSSCSLLFSATPSLDADADALSSSDAAMSDATIADASLVVADGSPDANPPIVNCGPGLPGTIALYSVDGDESSAMTGVGGGDGTYLEFVDNDVPGFSSWIVARAASRAGCGQALDVHSGNNLGRIPGNAIAEVKSLDFWFHFSSGNFVAPRQGLLTKDQSGPHDGDFGLFLFKPQTDVRVVPRTQHGTTAGDESYLCSDTLSVGWHHVAVSFESMETLLFVDGTPATVAMPVGNPFGAGTSCTTTTSAGISVTSFTGSPAWFWGMSNHKAPTPLATDPFSGLLDELRFRDQVFTQPEADLVSSN